MSRGSAKVRGTQSILGLHRSPAWRHQRLSALSFFPRPKQTGQLLLSASGRVIDRLVSLRVRTSSRGRRRPIHRTDTFYLLMIHFVVVADGLTCSQLSNGPRASRTKRTAPNDYPIIHHALTHARTRFLHSRRTRRRLQHAS